MSDLTVMAKTLPDLLRTLADHGQGTTPGTVLLHRDRVRQLADAADELSAEVERLARINRGLVKDYNTMNAAHHRTEAGQARHKDGASMAEIALTSAQSALNDAQRAFDNALGIVRKEMTDG